MMERDKRVQKTMQKGAVTAIAIAALGTLSLALSETLGLSGLLRNTGIGLMMVLPISLLFMTYRGYQTMDEYGRTMLLKAGAVAFMVVMGLSMVYFPLQMALNWPGIPGWAIWTVGATVYGIAMAVQSRTEQP